MFIFKLRRNYNEIYSALKDNNEIWFLANGNDYYVHKGIVKSSANTIHISQGYYMWSPFTGILLNKEKYICFFSQDVGTYKDTGHYTIYYLTRINKNSLKAEYYEIINEEDYNFHFAYGDIDLYYGVNVIYLVLYDIEDQPMHFYYVNNECNGINEINEEIFTGFVSQNQNIIKTENGRYYQNKSVVKDENGRIYRVKNGFEVSVDNGSTWYSCDIGTNIVIDIIIQNNIIYVFCSPKSNSLSFWGSKSVGGGIHVFQWD